MTDNADHKAEATADLSEDPNPQSFAESQETDAKEQLRKRRAEKWEKHAHGALAMGSGVHSQSKTHKTAGRHSVCFRSERLKMTMTIRKARKYEWGGAWYSSQ